MAPQPQSVRPMVVESQYLNVHRCGITLSPVKRGSRDIIDTLKHQCDCAPRSVSMGEYVISPRVSSGQVQGFSKESSHLLAESDHVIDLHTTKTINTGQKEQPRSSLWGSTFTLTNTILGSGTLAVPFAMASSGWLLGNVIMLSIAMVTRYSVHLLLSASDRAGKNCAKTYESLGHYTMGAFGTRLAEFTFIFGGFGTLVSYLIFVTDLCAAVLAVSMNDKWIITVTLVASIVFPLSLSRRIGKLWLASVLAILSIGYVVSFVLVAFVTVYYTNEASIASDVQAIRLESGSVYTVTLLISAFACHNTALPVYEELKDRSLPRMNRAVIGAISVSYALYEVISLCGYLLFGSETQDNILLNFSPSYVAHHKSISVPILIGQLCMALALILTTPIAMWPFRSCVLSVYLRVRNGKQTPSHEATYKEYVSVTVLSLILIVTCSIFVPSVKIPLSIVGSVSGSLLIFIMPALFYLLQSSDPILSHKHAGPLLMLCAGVVIGFFGLSLTLFKLYHEYHFGFFGVRQ
ncbi:probable sodium-coupled neutral amino acid transporter 6 [Plasmopara halstedii]|uniref:Probable sodium-coupled neutral amino acid transporter 6 n=1 Tax=Plasmopara halstedii TaxID=4781 RepID=A0A0P1ARD7_PLAHL|nr:probable sodium-coupled neutral amino acid transporter 6 [Plasmopara halstedii]CEG43492.1 probable sodium-coupled neutral amino acid transporter 6 [Plasmopara halstedii]|eukprot:XP_024579861.1 probable sodium-coupled neutral amino acid transporter 6 [Plasmopara halstedii]